jgi:tellurite resistance protein
VNFKDAAQQFARSADRFITAFTQELAGKQTETQAIETARAAMHKVTDVAADDRIAQAALVDELLQLFQGEQP